MTRICGWAPRGTGLTAMFPMVTGSRVNPPPVQATNRGLTFLTSLRHDRLIAPFRLDGPINGDAFPAGVRQCLAPTLVPGAIVAANKLASHKGLPARQRIRDAAAHPLFRFRGKPSTRRLSSPSTPTARTWNPIGGVFNKAQDDVPTSRRVNSRNLMAKGRNSP